MVRNETVLASFDALSQRSSGRTVDNNEK